MPAGPGAIRVAIGEDQLLVREGIRLVLDGVADIEILAVCGDHGSLVEAVEQLAPDVVLTDIRMPPSSSDEGIRLAAWLREAHPDTGVVVLSQYDHAEYALRLFEHGSERRAYLLKERVARPGQLAAAIREVAGGGSVVDPRIVDGLVEARLRARESPLAQLTAREREVLSLVAEGRSNAAIAASLFLTKRSVEKHINGIFAKLGLRDQDEQDVSRRVKVALLFLSDSLHDRERAAERR